MCSKAQVAMGWLQVENIAVIQYAHSYEKWLKQKYGADSKMREKVVNSKYEYCTVKTMTNIKLQTKTQ